MEVEPSVATVPVSFVETEGVELPPDSWPGEVCEQPVSAAPVSMAANNKLHNFWTFLITKTPLTMDLCFRQTKRFSGLFLLPASTMILPPCKMRKADRVK